MSIKSPPDLIMSKIHSVPIQITKPKKFPSQTKQNPIQHKSALYYHHVCTCQTQTPQALQHLNTTAEPKPNITQTQTTPNHQPHILHPSSICTIYTHPAVTTRRTSHRIKHKPGKNTKQKLSENIVQNFTTNQILISTQISNPN